MSDLFEVPELTRGLRSFASPGALGPGHDRFFAPLLDARRAAKQADNWERRLMALDAERLHATVHATIGTLAAERHPTQAPERRALAAHLDDACAALFDALGALGTAQRAVRGAPDDAARAEPWRLWVQELRATFAAADRGWEEMQPVLAAAPLPKRAARLADKER